MYTDNQSTADKFLQEKILVTVYHYITGVNSHRYIDMLRGMLITLFDFNLIDFHKFEFLFNFVAWLENHDSFSENEKTMYQLFYDSYVLDINDGLNFGLL